MIIQTDIFTNRLRLRPFTINDAGQIQEMASDSEIAATTLHLPHPYPEGMAAKWIGTHQQHLKEGTAVFFAIEIKRESRVIGTVKLMLETEHERGKLGYWIGKPYWGKGYATEAAEAVLRYGFDELKLNRIYANCFGGNPASGKILRKIGMVAEGCLAQHVKKWGKYIDLEIYGLLQKDAPI